MCSVLASPQGRPSSAAGHIVGINLEMNTKGFFGFGGFFSVLTFLLQ